MTCQPLRPMTPADLPGILALEHALFGEEALLVPPVAIKAGEFGTI